MTVAIKRLSGKEWQHYANQLLRLHYGQRDYQPVPDRHHGDGGIEGFSISDGCAYQAYGCDEPISVAERYEKQRDKMTEDIVKFISNKKILQSIFGDIKISRWILFVPSYDSKDIVSHAAKKNE